MFFTDLLFAWRLYKRNVGGFGLVIVTLGMAIGMTTAVFILTDALILHPLPLKDEQRVVHLGGLVFNPPSGDGVSWWGQAQALESLATYSAGKVHVEGAGGTRWARAAIVSSGFLSVFAVKPSIGRDFTKSDEQSGPNQVAILSHTFWRAYFGGRQSALGEGLRLNDVPYIVVGVAPAGFNFPTGTELWLPRVASAEQTQGLVSDSDAVALGPSRGWVGRLRPQATLEQATSELDVLLKRLHELYSAKTRTQFGDFVSVKPLREVLARNFKPALKALLAGAIFALLVACANCAMFLLGQAAARRREIAIRQVFGGTPGRILRQMLTETAALGAASGLLGFVVARWAITAAQKLFPQYPVQLHSLSPAVFGTVLLVPVLVVLLAGLVPALQCRSLDASTVLKDRSGSPPKSRGGVIRKLFVALEMSLALVLTTGAVLSVKTFSNLTGLAPGFTSKDAFVARLTFPKNRVSQELFVARQQQILQAAGPLPNIVAIGATSALPISGPAVGQYVRHRGVYKFCLSSMVAGDYFRAMGIPVVAGREFSETDSQAVIINERMSREFWQGRSPIGEQLRIDGEGRPRQVVGVVKDTRSMDLSAELEPQFYLPYARPYGGQLRSFSMYLVFRCTSHCAEATSLLLQQLATVGGADAMDQFAAMEDLVETAIVPVKVRATLLSGYAFLALGLALVGVYTLVSYLSTLRTYEMGVRMALGARPVDIVLLIVGEGIASAAAGVAAGGVASLGAVRVLESLLFGVKPLDPASLVVAGGFLLIGALLASLIPAVRLALRSPWELLQAS